MTEHKNGNQGKDSGEDWEFTTVKPKIKYEDDSSESQVKDTKMVTRKAANLILDESAVPRMKSRSAMAQELQNSSDKDEDVYTYASTLKRGIAFLIDIIFILFLSVVVKFITPFERMIIQLFLDKYNLQFILPEIIVSNVLLGITAFAAIFIFIIIPLSFFNLSFGKKLLGVRVRGNSTYTISLGQAIKRELIFKPISILILAGLVTPFFTKKKQSIHDMMSDTFVIEE